MRVDKYKEIEKIGLADNNFLWVTWALFLDTLTVASAGIGLIPFIGWILAFAGYVFVGAIGIATFRGFVKKKTQDMPLRIRKKFKRKVWKAAFGGVAYPWILLVRPIKRVRT